MTKVQPRPTDPESANRPASSISSSMHISGSHYGIYLFRQPVLQASRPTRRGQRPKTLASHHAKRARFTAELFKLNLYYTRDAAARARVFLRVWRRRRAY